MPGLDEILAGGLPTNHLYLVEGEPGSGKTTLALQFLLEGASKGERGLYVTLSESEEELNAVAASHGWSLDGITIFELSRDTFEDLNEGYTLFHPAEVELKETVDEVLKAIQTHNPLRVVFDSLSEMRLLARDPLRFRRQILSLKQFFSGRQATVLLIDDKTAPEVDLQLHSLAHGVVSLEHVALEYGSERRRLQVTKMRGVRFRGGYHDFRIITGGVEVYPRVRQETPKVDVSADRLLSGSSAMDKLLGGGLTCGTSVLLTGAAGTGKSVLCTQFARSELAKGKRVLFYLFDERLGTFTMRTRALEMPVDNERESGQLILRQVEPTELSPGEFASQVVRAVEDDGVSLVVIDSINGYLQAMPEERLLAVQIHELLSFLSNHGVTCIMTLVQHGIFGNPVDEAVDVSYLADTVILLRYFEVAGTVRQAISVVKKRSSDHERMIRECKVQKGGLFVGEPLREFQGVLTGIPTYTGDIGPLLAETKRAAIGAKDRNSQSDGDGNGKAPVLEQQRGSKHNRKKSGR
ncbi:MAG TPA: ATPase domain-containing protein [Gemmatimonadaceae bacterium]|nr:ATPase domain-containing protein [Gemmatimonadaceae bacterium]